MNLSLKVVMVKSVCDISFLHHPLLDMTCVDSKKSIKFCNSKKQFRLAYWKILNVAAAEEWDVFSSLTVFSWIFIIYQNDGK